MLKKTALFLRDGFPNRNTHLKTHIDSKLPCNQCNAIEGFRGLKEHIERIHEKKLKTFPCQECNLSFTSLSYLTKVHARKHSLETTRLECLQCDKTFAEKSYLMRHYKTHIGQKDHKCTECEKKIVRSGQLRTHLRIHTGQKPYKCSQCQKSFSEKNTLNYQSCIHVACSSMHVDLILVTT